MKNLTTILLMSAFFGLTSRAQSATDVARKALFESMPSCGEAVFFSSDYFGLSLASSNHFEIVSVGHPKIRFEFMAKDQVVDLKIVGDLAYVLTQTDFEVWDIKTQTMSASSQSHPLVSTHSRYDQRATGFVMTGSRAVISHGALGFSVLDTQSMTFVKLIEMPTPSMAQDIAIVDSSTAVVAVDSSNEPNFQGIYVMDLNSFTIIKQVRVDNAFVSGIRVIDQNRLVLVYFNSLWKFDLKSALSSRDASPRRRQPRFPGVTNADIVGKVFFDEQNAYLCFESTDAQTHFHQFTPRAISLKDLDF